MPSSTEIKLGAWYFIATCPACERQHVVGKAPSPRQQRYAQTFAFSAHCACGKKNDFPREQILRMRAQAKTKAGSSVVFRRLLDS